VLWAALRDAALRMILSRIVERPLLAQVNTVRASVGLAAISGVRELFAAPHRLLYMTAEPFEYKHFDWPANLRLVGPCEWNPLAAAPEWLDKIERPLVLISTSSEFQDDDRLVRCALEALSGDDVFVLATVPAGDPARFAVPANAKVLRFVPHAPILARAACAVTHGGMGVTQKALARGVPVCAVPFGRDQLEVARRVEMSGAGTRLPAQRLTPERLRAKVREAMARREGARQIAIAFAAAGGAEAAADAVEELLIGLDSDGEQNRPSACAEAECMPL
jgi:MGT family glycosyltransferase